MSEPGPLRYLIADDVHERLLAEAKREWFIAGAIEAMGPAQTPGWVEYIEAEADRRIKAEKEST